MNGQPTEKHGSVPAGDSMQLPTTKTRAKAEAWDKKRHSYKPLPKQFRSGGFTYRQIARQDDRAIYEQSLCNPPNSSVCYEVIRIRRRNGFQIADRFVEPAEVYPNSKAWGADGFTKPDKDAAVRFFNFLKVRAAPG
jgi:hypothetical protein